MAIDEFRDHLNVIIDWSSIGQCQSMLINNNYIKTFVIDWSIDLYKDVKKKKNFPAHDVNQIHTPWH